MRIERSRFSISQGNAIQGAMLITGVALLWLGAQRGATILRIASMLIGYGLIYFSVHAPAHWLVGRVGDSIYALQDRRQHPCQGLSTGHAPSIRAIAIFRRPCRQRVMLSREPNQKRR